MNVLEFTGCMDLYRVGHFQNTIVTLKLNYLLVAVRGIFWWLTWSRHQLINLGLVFLLQIRNILIISFSWIFWFTNPLFFKLNTEFWSIIGNERFISVYLSDCLSVCLYAYMPICLSVYLSICLSIYLCTLTYARSWRISFSSSSFSDKL